MFLFNSTSKRQLDIALVILRLVVGAVFIAHGGQKMFVFGFEGVAQGFAGMGVPMAGVVGPFIALVEFFGGIALILGVDRILDMSRTVVNVTGDVVATTYIAKSEGIWTPAMIPPAGVEAGSGGLDDSPGWPAPTGTPPRRAAVVP